MKRLPCFSFAVLFLVVLVACGPSARSGKSFDEIRRLVAGKTAAEVEKLLGSPNSRVRYIVGDERWIWWSFVFLSGEDYAPEVRGKVVHLSITFENPAPGAPKPRPYSEWRVVEPLGVSYTLPQKPR